MICSTNLHSRSTDSVRRGPAPGRRESGKFGKPFRRPLRKRWLHMRFVSQITLSPAAVFSEGKGTFFSNLPTRLRSGEGAFSLFSSLLRSDEPGAPPPAAAEVAQASRRHFRRTITARTSSPRCPARDMGPHQGRREGYPCGLRCNSPTLGYLLDRGHPEPMKNILRTGRWCGSC